MTTSGKHDQKLFELAKKITEELVAALKEKELGLEEKRRFLKFVARYHDTVI